MAGIAILFFFVVWGWLYDDDRQSAEPREKAQTLTGRLLEFGQGVGITLAWSVFITIPILFALYGLSTEMGGEGNTILYGVAILVIYILGVTVLLMGADPNKQSDESEDEDDEDEVPKEPHEAFGNDVGFFVACMLLVCVLFGFFLEYVTAGDAFTGAGKAWVAEAFLHARDALLPLGESALLFSPAGGELKPGWPHAVVVFYSFLIQLAAASLVASILKFLWLYRPQKMDS